MKGQSKGGCSATKILCDPAASAIALWFLRFQLVGHSCSIQVGG